MASVALERFGKALEVTGPDNGHVAWWLANDVPWESDAHMNDFLTTLGSAPPAGT
jgi:hypothetical protein